MRHQYSDADKAKLDAYRTKVLEKRERLIDDAVVRLLLPEPVRRREAVLFAQRLLGAPEKKDALAALLDDIRSTRLDADQRQALQATLRRMVATEHVRTDRERTERLAAEHSPAMYAGIRATLLYQRGHTDTPPWAAAAQEG